MSLVRSPRSGTLYASPIVFMNGSSVRCQFEMLTQSIPSGLSSLKYRSKASFVERWYGRLSPVKASTTMTSYGSTPAASSASSPFLASPSTSSFFAGQSLTNVKRFVFVATSIAS